MEMLNNGASFKFFPLVQLGTIKKIDNWQLHT